MSPRRQSNLSLEHILLGFLESQPAHGYDLYKMIRSCAGISLIWNVKQSLLYAQLDKLEKMGMLTSTQIPGEVHPWRREFRITEKGRQQFDRWRSSPVEHGRDMRQEFLARLFFARQSSRQTTLDLIEKQKVVCEQWLADMRVDLLTEQAAHEKEAAGDVVLMIYQFRIKQVQAMLDWLDECKENLR